MDRFYYLDAGALVKRYVEEIGSQAVQELLRKESQFFISKVAYAEVFMSFRRKNEEGTLGGKEFSQCLNGFEADWEAFNIIEVSNEVLKTLRNRIFEHSLRALDALHLASALWLKEVSSITIVFVCSDHRLKERARLNELDIYDPTESQ